MQDADWREPRGLGDSLSAGIAILYDNLTRRWRGQKCLAPWAFGLWLDGGRPNRWRFCFRPKDSARRRVLFSFDAARAKVRRHTRKQNFRRLLVVINQRFRH